MSKVGIIVTTYTNYGKFLDETIDSILKQTYKDFELIIVDDCSKDYTIDIVKEQELKDKRIRTIFNKENLGMGLAKNVGIRDSNSPYILCVDADDLLQETFLEKHVKAMEENKGDIIYSHFTFFGLINNKDYKLPHSFKQITTYSNVTHSALYKKSDWELVGGYKDVTLSDWEFWINMGKNKKKFYIIPEFLFLYRKHSEAITVRGDTKIRMGETSAIKQVHKCHPDIFNIGFINIGENIYG